VFAALTLLGSGLAAIGSILPWVIVVAPFVGSVSVTGVQGDGLFTLILGVLGVVLGVVRLVRPGIPAPVQRASLPLGLIIAIIGIVDLARFASTAGRLAGVPFATVSIGPGIPVLLVGAAVAMVGGIVVSRNPVPRVPPGAAGPGW
jgi:hypothetical protein